MAASSGLRENDYPINFFLKMLYKCSENVQYGKSSKGDHVHQSEQSHIQQEHWEVQPATPLGWNIAFHSRVIISK